MTKGTRKFLAGFVFIALITLVAGLCYGSIAEVQAANRNITTEKGCGEYVDDSQKSSPLNNGEMACCIDHHDNIPTTQASDFNSSVKFSAVSVAIETPNLSSFFQNKLSTSADSSPPELDKLSSVLRLE